MDRIRFESIGAYTPQKEVTTKELIEQMNIVPAFDLEELTGIKKRRWRSEEEGTYELALAAAEECLRNSKYNAEDLDIIISASITRSIDGQTLRWDPSISQSLRKALGADAAIDFDITNACAGMMTGAYILMNMIKAGTVKNGMVVSGECITPIAETAVKEIKDPIDEQFGSLTVGDAGAAYILDISPDDTEGIDFCEFTTIAEHADLCFGQPSVDTVGIQMHTRAIEIHAETIKRMSPLLDDALSKHGKDVNDYDYFIPHQTSSRAIAKAQKTLQEYFEKDVPEMMCRIENVGNTASTTHFLLLYNQLKEKTFRKGTKLLLMSFSSGINIGYLSTTLGDLEVKDGNCH